MFKPNLLALSVSIMLSSVPVVAVAEIEISGEAKVEHSIYTEDGLKTGSATAHESGDAMKSELGVKLFLNGDVGEDSSFHAEVLFADDSESIGPRLDGGEAGTQYEILRELYMDTTFGEWDFRLGKQQVVWGTADGIKLLDIINPTDFRELNQNTSEDSRIPLWMVNAERYFDDGSSIQLIASEAKPNIIAGLSADGEYGSPFIFKGVDTITGATNGFLHIAQDMGKTSGVFQTLLGMGGLTSLSGGPMATTTVSGFTALGGTGAPSFSDVGASLTGPGGSMNGLAVFPGPLSADATNAALLNVVFLPFMSQLQTGNEVLNQAANSSGDLLQNFAGYMQQLQGGLMTGTADGAAFTNTATAVLDITGDGNADTNLIGTAINELGRQMTVSVAQGMGINLPNPADMTDVANQAALGQVATNLGVDPTDQQAFGTAVQTAAITGLGSAFFSNSTTNQFTGQLNTSNPTSAFDYMGNTTFATFTNFIGMQTSYREMHGEEDGQNFGFRYKGDTDDGTNFSLNYAYRLDSNPYVDMHWEDQSGNELSVMKATTSLDALGQPRQNADGSSNGNPNPEASTVTTVVLQNPDGTTFNSNMGATPATLVFEEKLNRISTIGASFDTAVDTDFVPVVLRGELSYDIGTKQPVIDMNELSIGNITEALSMQDADILKYVFGVDVTVMQNLLISTQLIQFYNLDYVDENNRYTGDFSSMHLTNGLKKGDEVETFISLFFSKPFGPEVQHRWNNILIVENDGGYWNRFDVEYSFNDNLIGTAEYNKYWGDENTTFGQFETSTNLQAGLKYLFQ